VNIRLRPIAAGALFLPLLISGCSLLPTTRKLPIPKAPMVTQTVAPEDLVARLNQRWAALNTLTATVEIQASVVKSKEGVAKDYTTIRGNILMRKPEMLRVYGRVPVIGTEMFDMVSDGKNFSLYIPSRNKILKGSNSLKGKSASKLENMRPAFFFDSMVVPGLESDDFYSVTADTVTVEDTARKHLYSIPEYILSISRRKPGSQELMPVRWVYFHRDDLLPYEQDVYDSEGNLETQVLYSAYQDFDSGSYPSSITIKRPLDEFQIVLTVEKVTENMDLKDDQFQINNIAEGTKIQNLE
jgi:outer membrane lipoprotein-sorting protein